MVEGAQGFVLQSLLSLPDPEQFPPFRSFLILLRDLVMVPPPQDFEQDDQIDQIPQTQSSGKKQQQFKTYVSFIGCLKIKDSTRAIIARS